MRILAAGCAVFLFALPDVASAQEMTAGQMIEQIQRTIGDAQPAARPTQRRPSDTRSFHPENGVDSERPPVAVAPPQPSAPAAPRPPATATTCSVAVNFNLILFERGSARISSDEQTQKTLGELVTALTDQRFAELHFFVRGHTDITGSYQTNLRLSQARAEAVSARLVAGGVRPDRVQARGLASTILIDPADPASFKNRRVDICI